MLNIDRASQITFFEKELEAMELEVKAYFHSEATALRSQKRLFVGLFYGNDEKRGNIIIKFRKGNAPRLKQPFTGFTVPNDLSDPSSWCNITYEGLRRKAVTGSSLLPIYLMKSDHPDFILMGFGDVEVSFAERLKKDTLIIIGETEPPFEYIVNLRKIVEETPANHPASKIIDINSNAASWSPELIRGERDIINEIFDHLHNNDEIVIQGPPGTGKTFLMADLCSKIMSAGHSVLVTTLTNRALIELSEKPQIKPWLSDHKVWKMRISLEEKRKLPELQTAKEFLPLKGNLLLATYYQASRESAKIPPKPIFDFVILEEASQAFLATIALSRLLGRKLIIVGDPMQLEPIVRQPHPEKIHPHISHIIRGMETFAYNSGQKSFRLVETYRLTPAATKLTGLFYENTLVSKSRIETPIIFKTTNPFLFDLNGGANIQFIDIANEGRAPKTAIQYVKTIVQDIHTHHSDWEVAVLTPFVETARALQETLYPTFNDLDWLTVETIDRIQGLTCDLTVFLLPFSSGAFSMKANRFNVATSRAKRGTLIIADKMLKEIINADGVVSRYLSWAMTKEYNSS